MNRGGIEQLTTMNILLNRYRTYRYRGIKNFDNFVTQNEKKAMVQLLSNPEPSLAYGLQISSLVDQSIDTVEELKRMAAPPQDPAVETDSDDFMNSPERDRMNRQFWVKSNKILAIGIPIGLRAELNKLMVEKDGLISIYDPTFSRVILEVWAKDITESNSYRPIKVVKYNLDYFTNRASRDVFSKKDFVVDDFKVVDKNDPYFRSQKVYLTNDEDDGVPDMEEVAVREYKLNEINSHLFKIYIKLLYGINFDESQFFVDRKLLDVDYSDSENSNIAYQKQAKSKI